MANSEENNGTPMSPTNEVTELRGSCNKDVVDLLDAFSLARGLSRTQLVNEILGEWARLRMHELNVTARVMRSKATDSGFGGLGR